MGYTICDRTVGTILKRRGMPPAPERKITTTRKECIRTHIDVLVAADFFTTEVWILGGLVIYYMLFFIRLDTREVHLTGVTPHPIERNHQGKDNVLLFPTSRLDSNDNGPVQYRERLGGLLKYYHGEAA